MLLSRHHGMVKTEQRPPLVPELVMRPWQAPQAAGSKARQRMARRRRIMAAM